MLIHTITDIILAKIEKDGSSITFHIFDLSLLTRWESKELECFFNTRLVCGNNIEELSRLKNWEIRIEEDRWSDGFLLFSWIALLVVPPPPKKKIIWKSIETSLARRHKMKTFGGAKKKERKKAQFWLYSLHDFTKIFKV